MFAGRLVIPCLIDCADSTCDQLAAIAHVIAIYYAASHGYDKDWHNKLDASHRATIEEVGREQHHVQGLQANLLLQAVYAAQIFFVIAMNLTRISTALFTARILNLGKRHRRMAPAIIAACGVLTLVLVLLIALRSPLATPWTALEGSQEMVSISVVACTSNRLLKLRFVVHSLGGH